MWRMRVVHATGYAYKSPVTASFNEARLTPRSDSRQNVILNRVETVPATRSYRYTDYWGTAVTSFDLHAPHTELEVTASSVVETEKPEPPAEDASWDDLASEAAIDRFYDLYVHEKMQKIVGDRIRPEGKKDPEGVERARNELEIALSLVDRDMGEGGWATGLTFTMADCAAAPSLVYAHWTHAIDASLVHRVHRPGSEQKPASTNATASAISSICL